jgi:2'-5' RNA ligase
MPPRAHLARLFVAVDVPADAREALADWGRRAARAAGAASDPRAPAQLRPVDADSVHLTLCFLGSRPVQEIDQLAAVLPDCAAHASELCVGAPVWLPQRRPRALAVAIADETAPAGRADGHEDDGSDQGGAGAGAGTGRRGRGGGSGHGGAGELERMQLQLRDALAAVSDWQPERRRFRAHITLVRVRGGGRRRRGPRASGERHGGVDPAALTAIALPATPGLAFVPESVTLYRSRLEPSGARYEALASCRLLPPEGDARR